MSNCINVKWKENGKLKLKIIVGTRPEIIRLSAVINKARRYFDTILVHTGQNYDYTDENISDKVIKLIRSYTGVVNKMVWRKD